MKSRSFFVIEMKRLEVIMLLAVSFFLFHIYQQFSSSNNFISEDILSEKKTEKKLSGINSTLFYDEKLFKDALWKSERKERLSIDGQAKAGTVPHHLLASEIISDFFSLLSQREIDTVILVGPNHYEKGKAKVLSSDYGWDTPFGTVEPDNGIIDALKNKSQIKIDNSVLQNEHSVGGVMPFIKYFLPKARVVPLILSGKNTISDMEILEKNLDPYFKNQKTIVLASVDFSHYLSSFESDRKDTETLEAIKSFDYEQVAQFGNDHLDSPPSLILLMKIAQALSLSDARVINHTNSGKLLGKKFEKNTSYISLVYTFCGIERCSIIIP